MSDINQSANWNLVYEADLVAPTAPSGKGYIPLGQHTIPILLSSAIIAAAASSQDVQPNWRLGYWLEQVITVPILGANGTSILRAFIPINDRFQLISLPQISADFTLIADIPHWYQSMSISIWEYTGANPFPVVYRA